MLDYYVVIPARLESSRLPRKVLVDVLGKPLLQRSYEQAILSTAKQVIIATDSEEVASVARGFAAPVVMTAKHHQSGTSRLQEVAEKLGWNATDLVVNVQADEPLIDPRLIDDVAKELTNHLWAGCATLAKAIDASQANNPNRVKVVIGAQGKALYFSRSRIPYAMEGDAEYWQHIGLYCYRVDFLNRYVGWPACEVESTERLEQLRILHNDGGIHVSPANAEPGPGIDTAEDLAELIDILKAKAQDEV